MKDHQFPQVFGSPFGWGIGKKASSVLVDQCDTFHFDPDLPTGAGIPGLKIEASMTVEGDFGLKLIVPS
jgi:hypothetical protein